MNSFACYSTHVLLVYLDILFSFVVKTALPFLVLVQEENICDNAGSV